MRGKRKEGDYILPLLLRLGIIPPDTEFNRRAAAYARWASRVESQLKASRKYQSKIKDRKSQNDGQNKP